MFEPQELLCGSLRDTLKGTRQGTRKWKRKVRRSERHSRVSAKNIIAHNNFLLADM